MKHGKFCLIMFFIVCLSCQNQMDLDKLAEVEEATDPEVLIDEEDGEPLTSLEGTKWKLVGRVEIGKGIIKEFKPKDCEECYTLAFDSDSTADSRSITDLRRLDLANLDPHVLWEDRMYYELYEKDGKWYEVGDFLLTVARTESYSATNEKLKLFHSGCFDKDAVIKLYYLLYKRIES